MEMQKEFTRNRSLSSHREWLRENVMEYDFPTCLKANKKNRRPTYVERLPWLSSSFRFPLELRVVSPKQIK